MARTRTQQPTLVDDPVPGLPLVECSRCKRALTDPISRQRRKGRECDPERRSGRHDRHEVDQDTLPGT